MQQPVKRALRLLDLPDELLSLIISTTNNPTALCKSCSRFHNLFHLHATVRASWLSRRYGRDQILFYPWLHIDHPALDAATVLVLINTGGSFRYTPLFEGKQGEDASNGGEIILDVETRRQIAWDVVVNSVKPCDPAASNLHKRLNVMKDPFDLWCWAADTNDDTSVLARLISAGADVNYRDGYAVKAAARRHRADLLVSILDSLGADIPAELRKESGWDPVDEESGADQAPKRRTRHSLAFVMDLLSWAPVSIVLSVLDRFDRPVHREHVFLQHIGRHNRVDILTHLERGKGVYRMEPFVMGSEAACAIFVGAAEGGHLALLTEMVLKYGVPIDYDSSLALRLSARHVRPAMLLAVLSLNATLPSHHESRRLAIDLLSWGTPSCVVALLDRTDTRGPHPAIESTPEFLYRLGQCGRMDVLKALQTLRKDWKMRSEEAGICLVGAAAGGHVELAKELVEVFGAEPGLSALKAAAGSIADTHDVILYLMTRYVPALVARDWGRLLIEACGIAGRGRAKVVKTILEMGGKPVVREWGPRGMVLALKTRQAGVAEIIRKAMAGVKGAERHMVLVENVWDWNQSEGSLSGDDSLKEGKSWEFFLPDGVKEMDALATVIARMVLKRRATHRLCGSLFRGSKAYAAFEKHSLIPQDSIQILEGSTAAAWEGWFQGVLKDGPIWKWAGWSGDRPKRRDSSQDSFRRNAI
ncbi:hypothetical protein HDV00_003828 [Rhizophlyctis rosea]|nr:hypothetical protein HDV00_003828 [Rhizophlyctis rosea]